MPKPTAVVTAQQTEDSLSAITEKFSGVMSALAALKTTITSVQNEVRALEASVKKSERQLRKEVNKHKKERAPRSPSGFARPTAVSPNLCKFMNKEEGTAVARTEVTQFLIKYIQENKLQNAENKKEIIPNQELQSLLGLEAGATVRYFDLQKHMNQHFPKNASK